MRIPLENSNLNDLHLEKYFQHNVIDCFKCLYFSPV